MTNISSKGFQGYLLDRLEIRNFGGYDGTRSIMRADGGAMIFTGENGAGKTTALDALRLIFNVRPAFNASTSQGGVRDRDISDYYLGRIRHTSSSGEVQEEILDTLRDYGNTSQSCGILAVFRNTSGHVFTAARLLYMPDASKYSWRNLIIQDDISLDGHLSGWPSTARVKEFAQERGGDIYTTFESYIAALGDIFGLHGDRRDRAFRVLDEAVSQNGMDSIEKFARRYILPESPLEGILENAEGQIVAATSIMAKIKRAKHRLKMLTDVEARIIRYQDASRITSQAGVSLEAIDLLANHVRRGSSRFMIRKHQSLMRKMSSEIDAMNEKLSSLDDERRRIDGEIENRGGNRIGEIRNELQRITKEIEMRKERISRIEAMSERAGLDKPVFTAEGWDSWSRALTPFRENLDRSLLDLERERDGMIRIASDPERRMVEAKEDLAALDRNRSSMPRPLVAARDKIAAEIGVSSEDMPFFGELLRIREGFEDWEGAANRVLDGAARNILVDPEHYPYAKKALASHHWGVRVVLLPAEMRSSSLVPKDSLASRIEVRPDTPFRDFAEALLAERAHHICLDEADFGNFDGASITRSGAMQMRGRAEKDDRNHIGDRSSYVLGWSVEGRRSALQNLIRDLGRDLLDHGAKLAEKDGQISKVRNQIAALDRLGMQILPFPEIDLEAHKARARDLDLELSRFTTKDIQKLQDRLDEIKKARFDLNSLITEKTKGIGSSEAIIEAKTRDLLEQKQAARNLPACCPGHILALRRILPDMMPGLGLKKSGVLTMISALYPLEDSGATIPWSDIRLKENGAREQIRRNEEKARDALNASMGIFLKENPEDAKHLSTDVFGGDAKSNGNIDEWRRATSELRESGLPDMEAEYEDRIRKVSVGAIQQISMAIRTYRKEAERTIGEMNDLLSAVVYDPSRNSRATLRMSRTNDKRIKNFERDLIAAASTALQQDGDLTHVNRVIDHIRDREEPSERRDRSWLIDLSNWIQIDLEERAYSEEGIGELLNIFEGPTGQSGGQKERLMSVLFGVGLSHMFRIHDPEAGKDSLRLIIMDEAFSNLDPRGTRAAAQVLSQLGLQIIMATPMKNTYAVSDVVVRMQLVSRHQDVIRIQPVLVREIVDGMMAEQRDRADAARKMLDDEGAA